MSWLIQLFRAGRIASRSDLTETVRELVKAQDAADTSAQRFLGTLPQAARADLSRLSFPSYFLNEGYLRQGDRADWAFTSLNIRVFAHSFIEDLRRAGLPFYVHTARRDVLEQARLKAEGRSKAIFPRAPHCQGEAVDIVHSKFHWELSKEEWAAIGVVGKRCAARLRIPIVWGGDWSFYDPAHWEIDGWRDRIETSVPDLEAVRYSPRALARAFPASTRTNVELGHQRLGVPRS